MTHANAEHFAANRRNWNERSHIHAAARGYQVDRFVSDHEHISDVVDFDRRYLGDIDGSDVVHLQCHIGTDTISLARLGASVTGLDQSEESLGHARSLFESTGTSGRFVEGNVYDATALLDARFDLVYTGVGAINWLPDIDRWAAVVADLLVPGGRVYLREGHPMLLTLDDDASGGLRLRYPYFETVEPMVFDETETYVETDAVVSNTRTYEWNHGLGEVFTALTAHGLTVTLLHEHRGLEWKMFEHMVLRDRRFELPADQRDLVPMMYSIIATNA